jgi:hypothetical protein
MDIGIRSRLITGFAVVGVGALVIAPVVAGQAPATAQPPVVTLTAVAQRLPAPPILPQPASLAPIQPLDPLAQQVGFHIAFVADFITTGAVLFGREFAIPGALLDDIQNGTPVPVAVGRALQTFAQVELDAGRELVGFAAEYVSFQLNFLANLVTMPVVAFGEIAALLLASLTPASAAPAPAATGRLEAVAETVQPTAHGATVATSPDEVTMTGQSGVETIQSSPKKLRSTRAESKSVATTTAQTDASEEADVDAAATPRRPDVTHKRVTGARASETMSSTTGGTGRTDRESQDHPQHNGHPKGHGNDGD